MALFNTPFNKLIALGGGGANDVPVAAHYILSPANMYADRAGTTNVTVQDDFVGNISDSSGNANTLVAPTDAARALAKTDGTNWWIKLDKVDDTYSTTFAEPVVGTLIMGTREGTIRVGVDIPAGVWQLTPNPLYFPGDTITDIIIYNGVLTDAQVENALTWFEGRGSPRVYTPGATDLIQGFRQWGILTSVIKNPDLSNVTNFILAFRENKITTIPFGFFDFAKNATIFQSVFYSNLITVIPAGLFDAANNCTNFGFAFFDNPITTVSSGLFATQLVCTDYTNCFLNTALSQQSIDNVLVSIQTSYTNNGLTGGRFDQSGGSAPSATGEAAIDFLRAQGMTVNVTGGY